MSEFIYYLGTVENSALKVNDYHNYISEFKDLTLTDIQSNGIEFCEDIPDIHGNSHVFNTTPSELKFDSLSDLLNDYLFSDEIDPDLDDVINEYGNDYLWGRLEYFKSDFLIIIQNKKDKLYTIVSNAEIENCFKTFINNDVPLDVIVESDTFQFEFDTVFNEFTNKIESLIESESAILTATVDVNKIYNICICKKDTDIHKGLIKHKLKHSDRNNFVYGNTYDSLKTWFVYYLLYNNSFGITLSVNIKKPNSTHPFKKVYGFFMYNDIGIIKIQQLSAKEMVDIYTTNFETQEKMDADYYTIYCGETSDDMLCGFDFVK